MSRPIFLNLLFWLVLAVPFGHAQAAKRDTTPNPFAFSDQTGAPLSTAITSNTITVVGINATTSISITGGSYSRNGGGFTTASGSVNNGDTVAVRQTS